MLKYFLLIFLTSCALFKKEPSLFDKKISDLIDAVKIEGSGRGRLGVEQQQYVFSYEAILKENNDWLLAVEIPLHGEEVMLLPELNKKTTNRTSHDSFEERIDRAMGPEIPISSEKFIKELRSFVQFLLANKLNFERNCTEKSRETYICSFRDQEYQVSRSQKSFNIRKHLEQDLILELVAENLNQNSFGRTSFFLKDNKTFLSLELFWRESLQ